MFVVELKAKNKVILKAKLPFKNNIVSNLLGSNLETSAPHKTVSSCLWLRATYILLVVLYSFIPLEMELFFG